LAVSDFMTTETTSTTTTKKTSEPLKIPAFLDCTLTAKANTVLYDNLTLKDVSGKVIIKDETVTLQQVKTSIFGGQIAADGLVSTKGKVPNFKMNLGMNQVNIAQTFTQLAMMEKIAPIAKAINGKLNSTIHLSGNLDALELTPDLKSISGDLIGELLSTTVNSKSTPLLTALDNQLGFIDLNKINLNDIKTAITFQDGKVNIKPFDLKYQDIKINVGGTHGFDQTMNYNVKFDVPAKYLGTEVNNLIAKLSPSEASKMESIPITAIVGGNFGTPKISTDLKQATTSLVNNLIKQQKDKLVDQGKSALGELIDKNKKPGDTTKTNVPTTKEEVKEKTEAVVKDKVKEGLNKLLNKNKKE
jgi:hypothetical protein